MMDEIDTDKEINDEWDKLRAHIKENYPDDFNKILRMCNEYGLFPKKLFEQGYRSGFNYVTKWIKGSMDDTVEIVKTEQGDIGYFKVAKKRVH